MEELDSNLSAFEYSYSINEYEYDFKQLMLNIYSCYQYAIAEKIPIPNNENKIRDVLLSYLKDTSIRQNICLIEGYRFDKEVDECKGRVDIKIVALEDFENHEAYYIIECKRVDGNKKLNDAYVDKGIKRFTTNYKSSKCKPYYSSYYGVNGMIGFVVREINIDKNISKIGNFFKTIEKHKLYKSTHDKLTLYHLMMDFSKNLK